MIGWFTRKPDDDEARHLRELYEASRRAARSSEETRQHAEAARMKLEKYIKSKEHILGPGLLGDDTDT